MFLSDVSIKRPVFATMMMVALVVLGVVSYKRLAIDEYPDITYPVVIAQTTYPGASPEVMDARRLAADRGSAQHRAGHQGDHLHVARRDLDRPRSRSSSASTSRWRSRTCMSKVARIRRSLPPDIEEPIIRRSIRTTRRSCRSRCSRRERSIRELTDLADRGRPVRHRGDRGRRRRERHRRQRAPDPRAARSRRAARLRHVSPSQVIAGARSARIRKCPRAASSAARPERLVRVTGRIVDPLAFADVVVAVRNGTPIRVGDVATVVDGAEERRTAARSGTLGQGAVSAVSLEVLKISGSNTVAVADAVRGVVAGARAAAAGRHQAARHPRRLAGDPRVARRRAAHDRARRDPHDHDHLPVPELVALDGHHRPHAAGVDHLARSSSCGCSTSR